VPPILQLSGTGDETSADFDVRFGWQIQWQSEAGRITISVTGDQDLGVVVDVPGPASGVTSPPAEGKLRLEIKADGPWSINVTQGTG
jgi:hypothetical protein